jgi:hypothetical protein
VPRRKQRELWASPPSPPPPGHFTINIFFAELTSHRHGRTGARHRRGRTARHQRLQLRWWSLSDPPPAPPRGPTIDVFNFGGGRCRTCRQHQLGGPPSTSSTSVVVAAGPAASTPKGARHRRFAEPGTCHQNFSSDIYQGGHRGKHYRYKQATWRRNRGKSFGEIFLGPYGAKNLGIMIPLQRLSPNQRKRYGITKLLE